MTPYSIAALIEVEILEPLDEMFRKELHLAAGRDLTSLMRARRAVRSLQDTFVEPVLGRAEWRRYQTARPLADAAVQRLADVEFGSDEMAHKAQVALGRVIQVIEARACDVPAAGRGHGGRSWYVEQAD